jgi:histidinol-phosphate phosphatase family protein
MTSSADPAFDIVVPTLGRPTLTTLLHALDAGVGPAPGAVFLVDDRRDAVLPLPLPHVDRLRVVCLAGGGRGPAAARNRGWRAAWSPWVAFLDDDVVPGPAWLSELSQDLAAAADDVGASQGRIRVPLSADRRPTDWERNVAGLETARWATADMAYRRAVLLATGGFDERFPRAYREDADLALRTLGLGWRLSTGRREVDHPVPPADGWVSVRKQAGNADDALMLARYGARWRRRAGERHGSLRQHVVAVGAGLTALAGPSRPSRLAGAAIWLGSTARFAWSRIAPGPRDRAEVARMLVTSVAIPPVAVWHRLRGELAVTAGGRANAQVTTPGPAAEPPDRTGPRRAVLLDRDGTIVHDVPYNGDPRRVVPVAGAREALDELRHAGFAVAVVSNQSGVAHGTLTRAQVDAVNARVDELLGPFDGWFICPHAEGDGCSCRKPAPGLVHAAATALGVSSSHCVVIGDTGADVGAARAAGARAILVPNAATRPEEIVGCVEVASDLPGAVASVLGRSLVREAR